MAVCHVCGCQVNDGAGAYKTVEVEVGRVSGALSFGGRSGTGTANYTSNSGRQGRRTSNSKGTTWRYSGGRKLFKKERVFICSDCMAAESVRRNQQAKIVSAVVFLLLAWWGISTLLNKSTQENEAPPAVAVVSDSPQSQTAVQIEQTIPSSFSSGQADPNRPDTTENAQLAYPALLTPSPAPAVLPQQEAPQKERTSIDEQYAHYLQTKCDGNFFCGESERWRLCKDKWSNDPPPGQKTCKSNSNNQVPP